MSMFKRAQGTSLITSLALIFTFALLVNLIPVKAEAQITIGPVSFVPLLSGQSATVKYRQTPYNYKHV